MIHPTRTNLLLLREKAQSVNNSVGILKARRQALIREFLSTTVPFLRSREDIRKAYGKAMGELALSLGNEGKESVESICHVTKRDMGVEIAEKSIWGTIILPNGQTVEETIEIITEDGIWKFVSL